MIIKSSKIIFSCIAHLSMFCFCVGANDMPMELKVVPNELGSAKSPTKEGLNWIAKFLEGNNGEIMKMIQHQSTLRNHEIDINNVELSLFVDDSDAKWNGIWALIASGQDSVFQSSYRYYFEFDKKNIITCRVYGIGLTIGVQATGAVRKYLGELEKNAISPIEVADTKREMFAGIWKLNTCKSESVAECFSANKDAYLKHDQDSFLYIDENLKCVVTSSFPGVYRKPWTGTMHIVKTPKYGEVFVLTDSNVKQQTSSLQNSRIVSLVDIGKLVIWCKDEYYEFHRTLIDPKFPVDKIEVSSLLKQRAGSIHIKHVAQ